MIHGGYVAMIDLFRISDILPPFGGNDISSRYNFLCSTNIEICMFYQDSGTFLPRCNSVCSCTIELLITRHDTFHNVGVVCFLLKIVCSVLPVYISVWSTKLAILMF